MNRLAVSLFGLFVFGLLLLTSHAPAQEPVNHQRLKETMGWMVGTWEDEAGQRTFRWALGGQVITWADVDPDTANATFYWDPSDKRVKAIGFGAAGWILSGVVDEATDTQVRASILNVLPSGNKLTGSLTYTLSEPGTMFVEIKITPSRDHNEVLPERTWTLRKVR